MKVLLILHFKVTYHIKYQSKAKRYVQAKWLVIKPTINCTKMSKIRESCRIAFSLWKHSGLQMIW